VTYPPSAAKDPAEILAMCSALDATQLGVRMAAADVDPDGTARIELLERRASGWWNFTTSAAMSSLDMAKRYDDAVLTAKPGDLGVEPAANTITIPRPHVPFGPKHKTEDEADADYLREAARTMEDFYKPYGSNLRATVVKLLRDAALGIEARAGEPRG
jgi:hypothetical protein